MLDKFPGGFEREANWAVKYKRRNTDPKQKHEYKVEVTNEWFFERYNQRNR